MKKRLLCLALATILLCSACGDTGDTGDTGGTGGTEDEIIETIDLQPEIEEVLENASYNNLEIFFDDIEHYEGQELVIANTRFQSPSEGLSKKEAVKLYAEEIFPKLLDLETIDKNLAYDIHTRSEDGEHRIRTYEKDYEDILTTIKKYDYIPSLVYADAENWTELYYTGDWESGVYLTHGVLSGHAASLSSFAAIGMIEDEKTYDCRLDDLSDSYLLMDGEKTIGEAKEEIEKYLNEHYPLIGEDNHIKNVIHQITVGKIAGTEDYAFKLYRTISYKGIPIREMPSNKSIPEGEFAFMGEGAMCESNKLDVTIGLINCYAKPEVERVITKVIPFQEVMERVAYYLTGETKFQLLDGSLEYRMFVKEEGYQMVPYWCFIAKNPNDDSMIKIYVDMETGETEHFTY